MTVTAIGAVLRLGCVDKMALNSPDHPAEYDGALLWVGAEGRTGIRCFYSDLCATMSHPIPPMSPARPRKMHSNYLTLSYSTDVARSRLMWQGMGQEEWHFIAVNGAGLSGFDRNSRGGLREKGGVCRGMNDRRYIAGRSIRWNDVWAREAYAAGHWSRTDFGSALAQAAALTPDMIAIDNDGRLLRCADLYDEARRLAAAMLAHIPSGSTVSFMLPNWWEAAVIYAASALAGMVVSPILPSLRHAELRHLLSDADSRLLFITPQWRGFDYQAMAQSVAESLSQPPIIASVRGGAEGPSFVQFVRDGGDQPLPSVDPDAAALILYTSGTSGRAKGVMHSQNSLRALVMQLQSAWQIDAGDSFYVPAPIGHIGFQMAGTAGNLGKTTTQCGRKNREI